MTTQRIGIVFNGATGELARRQHLPGLMAIRDEGGLRMADGTRLVPDLILVGRDPAKLAATVAQTGFTRHTISLDTALSNPDDTVFFDAAPSGLRPALVRRAIAAGKQIYCEKPIAGDLADALALHHLAQSAGLKSGTVQDKLFLPGFAAMLALRHAGFFGRVLEVRVEMGRWIFDGFTQPGQRPSWNYRKQDGGGLILDMFPHWRYMIDALAGEVRSVSAVCRTHIPRRRSETGADYAVDVEDSVFADLELADGAIASINSSWATRARREFPIQVQIDGLDGSAVAGPFACWQQTAAQTMGGPISAAVSQGTDFFAGWDATPVDPAPINSYRAGWEMFLRHVIDDTPFPYTLLQGAKGVQLAEAAYQSVRERRWVDLPSLAG
ncbi:Gfo/Idh/MocA family protein [Acidisphaera sp. L21]|uniref:Gfo/Idh/MocA family protein n=1 Tax=Acidisphaera sp. L21 TaxID=1641851 RepID=UPI00131DA654|nr:Gfo/Idh/MocA family oxidoreductase [Acidisphaera sp. L21]